jgi:flagellar protein FlgJ
MSDLVASPDLLRGAGRPPAPGGDPARMRAAAEQFESQFLAQMLRPVFDALPTDGPFGGGEGEAMWRSFMVDAMAQQTVRAGGLGLSDAILAEMIRLQEARP